MKRIIRWIILPILILALLAGALHFWIVAHAEEILSQLVNRESGGQVFFKAGKVKYNYKTHRLRVLHAEIYNKGEELGTMYHFTIPEVNMQILSLRQLVFDRKLSIFNLYIPAPVIEVTRKQKKQRTATSLSKEMGRVYNSIRTALERLQIKELELVDGKFILKDQSTDQHFTSVVSNIYFRLHNLNIKKDTGKSEDVPFLAENLQFKTTQQHITLPGGKQTLGFAAFNIDLQKKILQIDSFYIKSLTQRDTASQIDAYFDSIRLIKIDFAALYNDGLIKADSIYCYAPHLQLELGSTAEKNKKFSLRNVLEDIGTDMDFNYVGLNNANLHLQGGPENKEITFQGNNRLIEMLGLTIRPSFANPLKVDKFVLEANNYESFSPDSLYRIKLESIGLEDSSLRVENVSVITHLLKPGQPYRDHHIPLLVLNGIDWQALLFHKKIVAEDVLLSKPIIIYKKRGVRNFEDGLSIYDAFDAINDLVTVRNIHFKAGSFHFDLLHGKSLNITGVQGMVSGKQLLKASTSAEMEKSVDHLQIERARLQYGRWNINLYNASFEGHKSAFKGASLTLDDALGLIHGEATNFSLQSIRPNDSTNIMNIGKLHWDAGHFFINAAVTHNKNNSKTTNLILGEIDGNNTIVNVELPNNANAGFRLQSIRSENLQIDKHFTYPELLRNLTFTGTEISYHNTTTRFTSQDFSLEQTAQAGGNIVLHQPQFSFHDSTIALTVSMPVLDAVADFSSEKSTRSLLFKSIDFLNPAINISLQKPGDGADSKAPLLNAAMGSFHADSTPSLQQNPFTFAVERLQLLQPVIAVKSNLGKQTIEVRNIMGHNNQHWQLQNFDYNHSGIQVDSIQFSDSIHINLEQNESPLFQFSTRTSITHITLPFNKANSSGFAIQSSTIPFLNIPGSNNLKLEDVHIKYSGAALPSTKNNILQILQQPGWELATGNGKWDDGDQQLLWYGGKYLSDGQQLRVDSFRFAPLLKRADYFLQQVYQNDYITAKGGRTTLQALHKSKDSTWRADTVHVQNLVIDASRDKRIPFKHGIEKKLPAAALADFKLPFAIKTLVADDMQVVYREMNDKTNQEGTVYLAIEKVSLAKVTSIPGANDSLIVVASGIFMDAIPFQVEIAQSYLDSLGQMEVDLKAGPGNLPYLNKIFIPLASLYVKSGRFSELHLSTIADKNTAKGTMLFKYQNLHIRILKKGNMDKKGFLEGIASFLADQFLLKHANQYRVGKLIHQRNKEKSGFNYLVKIIIKGLGTSTGLIKSKQ